MYRKDSFENEIEMLRLSAKTARDIVEREKSTIKSVNDEGHQHDWVYRNACSYFEGTINMLANSINDMVEESERLNQRPLVRLDRFIRKLFKK